METTCNPMLAMAPVHVIAVKGCPLPGRLDQKEGDSNQAWVAGKSGLSSWYTLSLNPESGVQKWCKKKIAVLQSLPSLNKGSCRQGISPLYPTMTHLAATPPTWQILKGLKKKKKKENLF